MKCSLMLLVVLVGCGKRGESGGEVSRAACFAPESLRTQPLVFSSIRKDYESDDYFGVEVRFHLDANGRLTADVKDARGAVPTARPVDSLRYGADDNSIWFSYSGSGTTYEHTLHLGCERLTGTKRSFATGKSNSSPARPDTLERVSP